MRRLIMVSLLLAAAPFALHAQERAAPPPAAAEADIPEAMQHMVTAPEVDIESLRDPFSSYLAAVAKRAKEALEQKTTTMANRPREPLEEYDLSTLKLVAVLHMGEERVAMVEDTVGKGYLVRRGNYIGKNNGRIDKITDVSVFLTEQVINPAGDVVDREVELTLKEINE